MNPATPSSSKAPINSWYALRWIRVVLQLKNLRNTFAREHPLAVFESILRTAFSREVEFFYHPVPTSSGEPLPTTVRKGALHTLEIIFPRATAVAVQAAITRLKEQLANPANNWSLEQCSAPELRDLATLLAERPAPTNGREIALNFTTGLDLKLPDKEKPWQLDPRIFFEKLCQHLAWWHGTALQLPADINWAELRLEGHLWQRTRFNHQAKSAAGTAYFFGWVGPLLLRGDVIAPLWPLLLLAQEWKCGPPVAFGQGSLRLEHPVRHFDHAWRGDAPAPLLTAWEKICGDETETPDKSLWQADASRLLKELAEDLRSGSYRPQPAKVWEKAKPSGDTRSITVLTTRDRIAQRALLSLLGGAFDRQFPPTCIGFRPGHSRHETARVLGEARAAGCTYAAEVDIADFFPSVRWPQLEAAWDTVLPAGDTLTRTLLRACVRTPILDRQGAPVQREQGLLAGAPLSPLLANLYLLGFDRACAAAGIRHVRFADDMLIFAPDEATVRQRVGDIEARLRPLGLELNQAKTHIFPLEAGTTFLGLKIDADARIQEPARLVRRSLYVRHHGGFVGAEDGTVVVRVDGETRAHVPLERVRDLVVLGRHTLSTGLIDACASRHIPIALAGFPGHAVQVLHGEGKEHYRWLAQHAQRHAALAETDHLQIARLLVVTKIEGHLAWLRQARAPAATLAPMQKAVRAAHTASTIEQLRGLEGCAAASSFTWLRDSAVQRDPRWISRGRQPHTGCDGLNALLDLTSHLVFVRLSLALRLHSLNPYLGHLHSAENHFPSLVCDLQEPFRPGTERWLMDLIASGAVRPDDFVGGPQRPRLSPQTLKNIIESFEAELEAPGRTHRTTMALSMEAWVQRFAGWVQNGQIPSLGPGTVTELRK